MVRCQLESIFSVTAYVTYTKKCNKYIHINRAIPVRTVLNLLHTVWKWTLRPY